MRHTEQQYTVQLTEQDKEFARRIVVARIEKRKSKNLKNYAMGDEVKKGIIGAQGEVGLSILFGMALSQRDFEDRDKGDIGGIEVRSTEYCGATGTWLVVNERDYNNGKLKRPYVCGFHAGGGLYRFLGWHFGWYVKRFGEAKKFYQNGVLQNAWSVESKVLLPMDEVICLARGVSAKQSVRRLQELREIHDSR